MGFPVTDWMPVAVAAVSAILLAIAGAVLTTIGPWYKSLRLPSWKPPDWAFGPVWTTIFTLTATAGVMVWNADPGFEARAALIAAYLVNGALNIAWSGLFFRMRRPDWALVEVLFLWLSVLSLVLISARVSGLAATLLLPYLTWVGVAAYLNLTIVRLNGPFRSA